MKRSFFDRRAFLIITVAALLFFPIAMGAKRALLSNQNNMTDWLPRGFAETEELDRFQEHFAGEKFIICTWDGCTLGNAQKLELLAKKLIPPDGTERIIGFRGQAQPGYTERGHWMSLPAADHGIYREHSAGSGDASARWKFEGLLPVPYLLQTTWTPESQNAHDATFRIYDGEKKVRSVIVDQTKMPSSGTDEEESTWHTLAVTKPRNGSLSVELSDKAGGRVIAAPVRLVPKEWPFKDVITGPRLLEQMTDPKGDLKLSREDAIARLRGLVIGPDHTLDGEPIATDDRQTCLIVTITDSNEYKARDLVGRGMSGSELGPLMRFAHRSGIKFGRDPGVLFQLTNQLQIAPEEVRLGGPPVDAVAIDEEGEKTLMRLLGLSALVGLGLAYWCFRSFRVTLMVFTAGVLSAMLCLAFVWWYGLFEQYALGKKVARFGTLDAVLMSMPAVIYVLGLSGAIHLINYYRDAVKHGGTAGAADRAVGMGWGPCALAAFTTAIGLASLYVSNIVPIQKFGVYSAVGVLGTLLALFLLLPALLELGLTRRGIRLSDDDAKTSLDRPGVVRFVTAGGNWILRHNIAVSICGIAIIVTGAIGLTKIGTSIQLLKLFSPEARLIADYKYLEHNLGHLIPMELVIRVDQNNTRDTYEPTIGEDGRYRYTLLERIELVQRVQQRIETLRMNKEYPDGIREIQPVGKAISVATFADHLDENWGDSGILFVDNEREGRNVLNKKLVEAYKGGKLPRDYWSIDTSEREELWRVHLRVAAFEDIDYGTFGREIRDVVEPVLATYRWRDRIIEQLAKKGKKLSDAKICVLGLTKSRDSQQLEQSLPLMLMSLLRHRGGATVTFHDTNFGKLPKGTPYNLAKTKAHAISKPFLGKQDLVIIDESQVRHFVPMLSEAERAELVQQFDPENDGKYPVKEVEKLCEPVSVEVVDLSKNPEDLSEIALTTLTTSYTGAVPVVYKAQRELLNGLIKSIALAFVTIAIVMMFKLGGVLPGLVSMIPNVFPVVFVFGAMGWLGVLVDIGAMMTASIALGVAVDDTVHFLTWFRVGLNEGLSRKGAVKLAYSRCARAMTQTTIIGGLGLSIFALSTFMPTKVFGVMMLAILTAALLGDLILLPSLLVGPLGRCFKPTKRKPLAEDASSEPVVQKVAAHLTSPGTVVPTPNRRRDSAHRRVDR